MESNTNLKPIKKIFQLSLNCDNEGYIDHLQLLDEQGKLIKNIDGKKYQNAHYEVLKNYDPEEEIKWNIIDVEDEKEKDNIRQRYENIEQHLLELANKVKLNKGENNNYLLKDLNETLKSFVGSNGLALVYVTNLINPGFGDWEYVQLNDNKSEYAVINYVSKVKDGELKFQVKNEKEKQKRDNNLDIYHNNTFDEEQYEYLHDSNNMVDFYIREQMFNDGHLYFKSYDEYDESEDSKLYLLFQSDKFTVLYQSLEEQIDDKKNNYDFQKIVYEKEYLDRNEQVDKGIVDFVMSVVTK